MMSNNDISNLQRWLVGKWSAEYVTAAGGIYNQTYEFKSNGQYLTGYGGGNTVYNSRVGMASGYTTRSGGSGTYWITEKGEISLNPCQGKPYKLNHAISGRELRIGNVWFSKKWQS